MANSAEAVTVSLDDLKKGLVSFETLQMAFGPSSLGILLVKDVPAEYTMLRHTVLSYSSYLGNLPKEQLAKLENPNSKYLTGWSLGKETLKNGQIDTQKGSYYFNCAFYVDPTLSCARDTAEFKQAAFPEYLTPNVWPASDVLPGFQPAVEALCKVIIDVAVEVAAACDRFAEHEIEGYESGYLKRVVMTSLTTKGRLLHYYPSEEESSRGDGTSETVNTDEDNDSWCTTHLDHGCLTGLTSAMYVDEARELSTTPVQAASAKSGMLPPLPELETTPDPAAGLYIKSRSGETVQVKIPRDCIAFQTGETLERITQGKFKAVPHFVRAPRLGNHSHAGSRVARNTLAIFTQPNLGEIVDREAGLNFGQFARGVVDQNTVK